jgi:hypothetical protein
VKKRSEVDRRLEQLVQKQSWKLKEPSKQSVIKVRHACSLGSQVLGFFTQVGWLGGSVEHVRLLSWFQQLWLHTVLGFGCSTTSLTPAVFRTVPAGAAHVQPL